MAIEKRKPEGFVELTYSMPVLDVRSPSEYEHAHIPGAFSFPIFSNDERKEIGTTYKQVSREKAIKIGLEYFGKKMVTLVERAEAILVEKGSPSKTLAVHCWRGGMRSSTIAWLLDLYGFKVFLLEGGYKAYRNWVLKQFECDYKLHIISGFTGSNKTGIINDLMKTGESGIDLEHLASHKGSAFGKLGMPPQPTQEMFENKLAMQLRQLQIQDPAKAIWIEDESQRIGNVNIPPAFFKHMREQVILFLEIEFNERLRFITETYGIHSKEELSKGIERIQKKLGGPESREAIRCLEEGDLRSCFAILLHYYDRLYLKSSMKRKDSDRTIQRIPLSNTDATANAAQLIIHVKH